MAPSEDRYAALKDLDEQLRELKASEASEAPTPTNGNGHAAIDAFGGGESLKSYPCLSSWLIGFPSSPQQQSKSLQEPATAAAAAAQQPRGESIPAPTAAAAAESLWPVDAHTKCLRQQSPAADGASPPPAAAPSAAAAAAPGELLQLQQQQWLRHLPGPAQWLWLRQHAARSSDGQQSLCSEYAGYPIHRLIQERS